MAIVNCTHCGTANEVDDMKMVTHIGDITITCHSCKKTFVVPGAPQAGEINAPDLGIMGRLTGIFSNPKDTFESINQKPNWLVPYLVVMLITLVMQFLTLDIQLQDQVAMMEAKGAPVEQIEMAQKNLEGPMKYIQFVAIPVVTLIVWVIYSGIFLFVGNTMLGGRGRFYAVFSAFAWSSLIGSVGHIVKSLLILAKGTMHGVTTSLAAVMPTPELGDRGSLIYQILAKTDIFMIWVLVVWGIGFSAIFKMSQNKSMTMVFSLWAIWIVISLGLASLFGNMF